MTHILWKNILIMKIKFERVKKVAKFRCNGTMHTIREGDTLYELSRQYNVPLSVILRSNPYVDVYNLQIGDEVCIPAWFNENTPGMPEINPMPMPTPPPSGNGNMPEVNPMPMPTPTPPPSGNGNTNYPFYGVYVYVIKDTDTLEDILEKFGITLDDFLEMNNLNQIQLKPGMSINIPRNSMYQ